MKAFFYSFILIVMMGCSSDDNETTTPMTDAVPDVITTFRLLLFPTSGQPFQVSYQDVDLDGPTAASIMSGSLAAGASYTGNITLLDEMAIPATDVDDYIQSNPTDFQVFYVAEDGLDATIEATDTDVNTEPVGLSINVTAGAASSGHLRIVVIYRPDKNVSNNPDAAGGTNIGSARIPMTIQ